MARTAVFLSPGADLAAAVDCARRADTLDYDSVWVTHGLGRDALLVLSAYARVAPRVGLGTGVIPIYPRHPVLMAQEALTLQEMTGGRLRLGIGVSHRPMMEGALGLDMGRPLEVMREYILQVAPEVADRVASLRIKVPHQEEPAKNLSGGTVTDASGGRSDTDGSIAIWYDTSPICSRKIALP